MDIERMSAPLGARILDIDITQIDDSTWSEINRLFLEHHVLVFPNQQLMPEDQIRFAARWGKLIPFPYGGLPNHPDIIELRNKGKQKDVNQHWHSDMTYNQCPPKLTMLYALEAPKIGGETAFSNQQLAYDELSEGMKTVLENLRALHSAKGLARLYNQDESKASEAWHPIIRTHEESGAKGLYVCKAFTKDFENWTREESNSVLEYLYRHSVRPEFQGRHQWQVGDLVMWDNRSVLHYAVHDHGDDPRLIHRCQVEGVQPQ